MRESERVWTGLLLDCTATATALFAAMAPPITLTTEQAQRDFDAAARAHARSLEAMRRSPVRYARCGACRYECPTRLDEPCECCRATRWTEVSHWL